MPSKASSERAPLAVPADAGAPAASSTGASSHIGAGSGTPAGVVPDVDLLHRAGAKVAVSSVVVNPKIHPGDLIDGDRGTAWNSRTGELDGAWIAFRVPAGARVTRIAMTVGFTGKGPEGDYFVMNRRIREVRVTRDGDKPRRFVLAPASRELQSLPIDGPGGDYRIEVVATVPGTRKSWREICVSELQVWGSPAPGTSDERVTPPVTVGSLDPDSAQPPSETDPDDGVDNTQRCEITESTNVPAGTVEIEVCTTRSIRHGPHDDGFTEYERHGTLTLKPAGTREDLGDWTDGWEWGTQYNIVGVLRGPRRTFGLLLSRSSSGPSPGLTATSMELTGMTLKAGAWDRTAISGGNALSAEVAPGDKSATLTWKRTREGDPNGEHYDTEIDRVTFNGTDFVTTKLSSSADEPKTDEP